MLVNFVKCQKTLLHLNTLCEVRYPPHKHLPHAQFSSVYVSKHNRQETAPRDRSIQATQKLHHTRYSWSTSASCRNQGGKIDFRAERATQATCDLLVRAPISESRFLRERALQTGPPSSDKAIRSIATLTPKSERKRSRRTAPAWLSI